MKEVVNLYLIKFVFNYQISYICLMFKVLDIVKEMEVGQNDTGYFATWEEIYVEGGTRNEAINNLLDEICFFNKTWRRIQMRLFFDALENGQFKEVHFKHPISLS